MLSKESLSNYFAVMASLTFKHKYQKEDLESMIPWEFEVYIYWIEKMLKEQKDQIGQLTPQDVQYQHE